MPGLMAQRGKRMDGRTNGRTEKQKDRQKISPFYKTLSPIGAAALLPPKKTKEGTAGQGSRWPFDAFGKLVFDEITSLCLKVRLPPHAFKKQLTSCCSTPSSKLANILNFSIAEKSKQLGYEKNFPFWKIHDISFRCLQEEVDKLMQRTLEFKIINTLFQVTFPVLTNTF